MVTKLIVVIILKYIEISNQNAVYQELTQHCRSIMLQKQMNKQTHIKRDQICGYQR